MTRAGDYGDLYCIWTIYHDFKLEKNNFCFYWFIRKYLGAVRSNTYLPQILHNSAILHLV